jgi:hypothetical protein
MHYERAHEALKGKTPAEVSGINIVGENKWITLIKCNEGAEQMKEGRKHGNAKESARSLSF